MISFTSSPVGLGTGRPIDFAMARSSNAVPMPEIVTYPSLSSFDSESISIAVCTFALQIRVGASFPDFSKLLNCFPSESIHQWQRNFHTIGQRVRAITETACIARDPVNGSSGVGHPLFLGLQLKLSLELSWDFLRLYAS
jgi:hypothetical protein